MRLSDKQVREKILQEEDVQASLERVVTHIQQDGCVDVGACKEAVELLAAMDKACYKWNHHQVEPEGLDK